MNTYILMGCDDSVWKYAKHTVAINKAYSKHFGYRFLCIQNIRSISEKPRTILKYMTRVHEGDWIAWLDCDAAFIDFEASLGQFLNKDIVLGGNLRGFDLQGRSIYPRIGATPSGVNTGIVLVRKSRWSVDFVRRWSSYESSNVVHGDQGILQMLVQNNTMDVHSHLSLVVPASRINREDYRTVDRSDFILHLWGTPPEFRSYVFSHLRFNRTLPLHKLLAKVPLVTLRRRFRFPATFCMDK